ncbi:uncharacterized protein B0I36DRAFT_20092 [Microdochium trichocladiopsis]|uniref:Uncharacterized protein n=1 Tax=Microdochium trichocladiopsis TaxID=1682393 RepID=A0A9P8YIT3_9PEZI|nr:uncharacterized protein B0I36DRAFT_20092 [Microdochium trichocladiopsis]KAH7041164.1 hypothetical protein B0I36DRAFT_20092 [Microdochium trichocladiopsis]
MPPAGDMNMARELQAEFSRKGGGGRPSRPSRPRQPINETRIPLQPVWAPQSPAARQPVRSSAWAGPLLTTADQARRQEPVHSATTTSSAGYTTRGSGPAVATNNAKPATQTGSSTDFQAHPQTLFSYNDPSFMSANTTAWGIPGPGKEAEHHTSRPPLRATTNLTPTAPVFKPQTVDSSAMSVDSDYPTLANSLTVTSGISGYPMVQATDKQKKQAGTAPKIVQSGLLSGPGLSSSRWA